VLKVLHPFVRLADKVLAKFKKDPIDDAVTRTIHNFSSAAHLITKNPKKTVQSFLWTTLSSVCEMGCFVLVGFAFGVNHPEALICGYVVATLFAMISFVPQGVGVVEAAVTVAFALFGVDSATGLAVVMVYRGIVFWLPFLVGAILIKRTSAFKDSGKKGKQPQVADAKVEEVLPENDSGNSGDSAAQPLPDGVAGDSASCKSAEEHSRAFGPFFVWPVVCVCAGSASGLAEVGYVYLVIYSASTNASSHRVPKCRQQNAWGRFR